MRNNGKQAKGGMPKLLALLLCTALVLGIAVPAMAEGGAEDDGTSLVQMDSSLPAADDVSGTDEDDSSLPADEDGEDTQPDEEGLPGEEDTADGQDEDESGNANSETAKGKDKELSMPEALLETMEKVSGKQLTGTAGGIMPVAAIPISDATLFVALVNNNGSNSDLEIELTQDLDIDTTLIPKGNITITSDDSSQPRTIRMTGQKPLIGTVDRYTNMQTFNLYSDGSVVLDGLVSIYQQESYPFLRDIAIKGFTLQNTGGYAPSVMDQNWNSQGVSSVLGVYNLSYTGAVFTLEDCTVLETGAATGTTLMNFSNCSIKYSYPYDEGIVLRNVTAKQADGRVGQNFRGYMWARENTTLAIYDSEFDGGGAYAYGLETFDENEVRVTGTTFQNFGATAIELTRTPITIRDSLFTGNSGVSLYLTKGGNLYNTRFENNTEPPLQVVRWITSNETVLEQCTFANNTGTNGGAVYATDFVRVINSSFTNNKTDSNYSAGAIEMYELEQLTVNSGTTFANNQARTGYIMDEADLAMYNKYIDARSFTAPFAYGYNNHDIGYTGGIPAPDTVDYIYKEADGTTAHTATEDFGDDHTVLDDAATGVNGPAGSVFMGWATEEDGEVEYTPGETINSLGNFELFAVFAVDVHTVTFDENGGSYQPDDQLVESGKRVKRPVPDPEKPGFTFVGWAKPNGDLWVFEDTQSESADRMPDSDLTLKAQYIEAEYVVTYLYNDAKNTQAYRTFGVGYGETVPQPGAPVLEGHSFTGWYTTSGAKFNFSAKMGDDDLVLLAGWQANAVTPPEPDSSSSSSSSQPDTTTSQPDTTTPGGGDNGGGGGGGETPAPSTSTPRPAPSASTPASASTVLTASAVQSEAQSAQPAPAAGESSVAPAAPAASSAPDTSRVLAVINEDGGRGEVGDTDYIEPNGTVDLFGSEVPMGGLSSIGGFSLVNLLLALAALVSGVVLLARGCKRGVQPAFHWAASLTGILPLVLVPFMENVGQLMILSRWTPLFIILAVLHAALAVLARISLKKPARAGAAGKQVDDGINGEG